MSSSELHFGTDRGLFLYARANRKPLTPSERKLWNCLRNQKLRGFKFRRQHLIANYIADFFCWKCKLVIEVDGGYHDNAQQRQYDADRDQILAEHGIRTIRFTNTQIDENLDVVLYEIERQLLAEQTSQTNYHNARKLRLRIAPSRQSPSPPGEGRGEV